MNAQAQLAAVAAEAAKRAAYYAGQADALRQVAQQFGGQVSAVSGQQAEAKSAFGFARALYEGNSQ